MNDTKPLVHPEVVAFVAEVRSRLGDLTDDDREDLLGGLEADLDAQVADGTPLEDPASYAAELRAAAGLPDRSRRLLRRPSLGPGVVRRCLDGSRQRFFALVAAPTWGMSAWEVVRELRPAWWVARAWVAVTLLDVMAGPWEPVSIVPSLGAPYVGVVVLIAAVLLSTLIGLGRLWPGAGPERPTFARLLLVALNVVAVVAPLTWGIASPGYVTGEAHPYAQYEQGYRDGLRSPGLRVAGHPVTNVFAYDALGRPLDQVQLFDQNGRPVSVSSYGVCPAQVLGQRARNVFPLELRDHGRNGCDPDRAVQPNHPLATVPPVDGAADAQDNADHKTSKDKKEKDTNAPRHSTKKS